MGRSAILFSALALALGVLPALPARADCVMPGPAPVTPRGAVATLAEMKQAHDALQAFVNALEAFQTCVEDEYKSAPPDTKPEDKRAWRAQGNAAIDLANYLKALYEEQVQIYKAHQAQQSPSQAQAAAQPQKK